MKNFDKLFVPLTVGAAVISIYFAFRGNGSQSPALAVTVPNPASGGVGLPEFGVQPVSYTVPAISTNPSVGVVASQPNNANPQGSQASGTPPYLAFNFGPSHNLSQTPASATAPAASTGSDTGCGCGGSGTSCANNPYSDGSLSSPLSSSRARQIAAQNDWIPGAIDNTNSYLSLEANGTPLPTLTTTPPPSPVDTTPTLGSAAPLSQRLQLVNEQVAENVLPSYRASGFAYTA